MALRLQIQNLSGSAALPPHLERNLKLMSILVLAGFSLGSVLLALSLSFVSLKLVLAVAKPRN